MARRHGAGGIDLVGVLSNIPVLITFVIAVAAWWTAFIGQIIYENRYNQANGPGSAVGVSWFGIFLELAIILMLFFVLAYGALEIYRFQLTAFLSIAVVFSVIGTNQGIFGNTSSQTAIGAGWLLLAIVNILWLLFITADDETRLSLVFSSYAGDVAPGRTRSMRQSRRTSSALGISNNQSSATDLHSHQNHAYGSGGPGYGNSKAGTATMSVNMHGTGPGPQGGLYGPGSPGMGSLHSMNSQPGSVAGRGVGGMPGQMQGGMPGAQSRTSMGPMGAGQQQQQQQIQQQPSNASLQQQAQPTQDTTTAAAAAGSVVGSNIDGAGGAGKPTLQAKALYNYTASKDDPNEISFTKGEILDILDNSGKWFNARKQDGETGIVPSNYLQML